MTEPHYLVFDTETTGVDTFNDRIVQLFIATADREGNLLETWEWIINPGIQMDEKVQHLHGFTNEFLAENGQDANEALWESSHIFEDNRDLIWVAYNLNFDFSILTAEYDRHNLYEGGFDETGVRLFDPLIADRHFDKYRKGKRKLENVAAHYGVPFDPERAHRADYDVAITAKVAAAVADRYGVPSNQEQAEMYASWAVGLQEYLRRSDPDATVDGAWPLKERHD